MTDRPTSSVELGWQGGFRFASQDTHGHTLTVDAPQSEGDAFEGMMPGDLLLTSLGSCSGIDVVNILRRQRQEVTGIEINVTGEQLPDAPWTWVAIRLEYTVRGKGLRESAVRRAIELSEEKYCSIGATIGGRAEISSIYTIIEG
ncbi:MAG: OsmC family protein [Chloroflexi bacterium]|nr:OsmC family protein [Chloroflexota bacterium]